MGEIAFDVNVKSVALLIFLVVFAALSIIMLAKSELIFGRRFSLEGRADSIRAWCFA